MSDMGHLARVMSDMVHLTRALVRKNRVMVWGTNVWTQWYEGATHSDRWGEGQLSEPHQVVCQNHLVHPKTRHLHSGVTDSEISDPGSWCRMGSCVC